MSDWFELMGSRLAEARQITCEVLSSLRTENPEENYQNLQITELIIAADGVSFAGKMVYNMLRKESRGLWLGASFLSETFGELRRDIAKNARALVAMAKVQEKLLCGSEADKFKCT